MSKGLSKVPYRFYIFHLFSFNGKHILNFLVVQKQNQKPFHLSGARITTATCLSFYCVHLSPRK